MVNKQKSETTLAVIVFFLNPLGFVWLFPKIGVEKPPKMDGENNGKLYEQMDDLGAPLFLG